jgi:hypothetical protein
VAARRPCTRLSTDKMMRKLLLCTLTAAMATCWAQTHPAAHPVGQQEGSRVAKVDEAAQAKRLLQSSMARQPICNIRVIFQQRLYYNSSVFQQVKMEMAKDGKVHHIVLSPLSLQGMEDVDDGVHLRTYLPDEKCVIEQPSAQRETDDISFRMGLVKQNYSLRIDRKEKIAGREAIVVRAVPTNSNLETRCYSIDAKTGFLLRLETCREGMPAMLHLETKMVEFPTEFSSNTFKLDASFVKTEHFRRKGVPPSAAYKLASDLGFQPIVPAKLPYGFEAQELQASNDSRAPALIVRMTDGLAKVTVYEWRRVGATRPAAPVGMRAAYPRNLTVLISGDVPDEVKDRILQAFEATEQAERVFSLPMIAMSWTQELGCNIDVFPLDSERASLRPVLPVSSWLNRN